MQVSPALTKSWIFRFRWGTKQRETGLGSLDLVPLAQARQKAYVARKQMAEGIDPIAAKHSERTARILESLGTRAEHRYLQPTDITPLGLQSSASDVAVKFR